MKKIAFAVTACLFSALLYCQVPPDVRILLTEASIAVGEVYRAPGSEHAPIYTEHWVLLSTYVYPGPRSLATLTMTPQARPEYVSEQDFFRRVAFPKGSKYVKVTAEEFTSLPVAR